MRREGLYSEATRSISRKVPVHQHQQRKRKRKITTTSCGEIIVTINAIWSKRYIKKSGWRGERKVWQKNIASKQSIGTFRLSTQCLFLVGDIAADAGIYLPSSFLAPSSESISHDVSTVYFQFEKDKANDRGICKGVGWYLYFPSSDKV
jgi:hypothetical protein